MFFLAAEWIDNWSKYSSRWEAYTCLWVGRCELQWRSNSHVIKDWHSSTGKREVPVDSMTHHNHIISTNFWKTSWRLSFFPYIIILSFPSIYNRLFFYDLISDSSSCSCFIPPSFISPSKPSQCCSSCLARWPFSYFSYQLPLTDSRSPLSFLTSFLLGDLLRSDN